MDILLLTVPAQHASENPSVELNIKHLKQWISKLPVMNVIETVEHLQKAIESFNELQVSDSDRLKLLEVYREAFDEILFFYDNARLHQLSIPAIQKKSLSDDIMWLYLGLASGYKTLVRNGFDAGHNPKRDTSLLLATYRAMELIVHALLYAYRAHETPPPLAYLEINQLYFFAEYHQVLETRIKAVSRDSVAPTIELLFKQFLMIAVADPYRIDGHEIHELYMLLEPFASHCVLSADMKREPGRGRFVFDLMEDATCCFYEEGNEVTATPYSRYLDLAPALKAIEIRLNDHKPTNSDFIQEQETRLLKLFAKHFDHQTGRQKERNLANRDVKMALGLSAVSYFLTDSDRLKSALTKKIEVHGGIEVSDVCSKEDADYSLTQWRIADETESGCMLVGDNRQLDRGVMIGDLLGLIDVNGDTSLLIGVILWKRAEENGQLKIGVQLVAGSPISVECVVKSPNSVEQQKIPAIYFPRDTEMNRPATLMASNELYEQHAIIQASVRGKSYNVQPGECLVDTPLYRQFRFSAVRE